MKSNFKLIDNYAIEFHGHIIDLHNNFDFLGISKDQAENAVSLSWIKSSGEWVPQGTVKKVVLKVVNVGYFYEIPGGDSKDKTTLMDLTWFSQSLRSENECVNNCQDPQPDDDIIFKFEDGRIIRLNGEAVEASVNPS